LRSLSNLELLAGRASIGRAQVVWKRRLKDAPIMPRRKQSVNLLSSVRAFSPWFLLLPLPLRRPLLLRLRAASPRPWCHPLKRCRLPAASFHAYLPGLPLLFGVVFPFL